MPVSFIAWNSTRKNIAIHSNVWLCLLLLIRASTKVWKRKPTSWRSAGAIAVWTCVRTQSWKFDSRRRIVHIYRFKSIDKNYYSLKPSFYIFFVNGDGFPNCWPFGATHEYIYENSLFRKIAHVHFQAEHIQEHSQIYYFNLYWFKTVYKLHIP